MNVLRPVHWREPLGKVPALDLEWGSHDCATCGPIGYPRALPLKLVIVEHLAVFHSPTAAPSLGFECERSGCDRPADAHPVYDDGPDTLPLAVYVCHHHAAHGTGDGPWDADAATRNEYRQATYSATVRAARDRRGVR